MEKSQDNLQKMDLQSEFDEKEKTLDKFFKQIANKLEDWNDKENATEMLDEEFGHMIQDLQGIQGISR